MSEKIDQLIAKHVMGYELTDLGGGNVGIAGVGLDSPELDAMEFLSFTGNKLTPRLYGIPQYSADISCAWQIVQKLQCLGHDGKWFFLLQYDNVELWDASFYKESASDGGGPEVWGTAPTAPLAICLAALKAVGVEVPE